MKLWTITTKKMNDPDFAKEVKVDLTKDEGIIIKWPSFVKEGEQSSRIIRDSEGDLLLGRNRSER